MNEANVLNGTMMFWFGLAIPILLIAVWFALPAVFVTPWFESVMRRRMVRARAQYEATAAAIQAYEQIMDREEEERGRNAEERFERRYGSEPENWTLDREAETAGREDARV